MNLHGESRWLATPKRWRFVRGHDKPIHGIELCHLFSRWYMGVSKNRGTPESSILIGFSIINHPFWGTIIFGGPPIFRSNSQNQQKWPGIPLDLEGIGLLPLLKGTSPPFYNRKYRIYTWYWANYNDVSRGHPKWWFSKGILPKIPLIQV